MLPRAAVSIERDGSELFPKGNWFKNKRGKLAYPFGNSGVAVE